MNKFHTTLQELLIGARSNYRLEIPNGLPIEMNYNNDKRTARLVNLSTVGASLELDISGELPRNKAEIKLQLALPDTAVSLSTLAKIVWIRKVTKDADSQRFQIGVKFMNLDEKIRDTLWNYIVASSPVARP